MEQVDYAAFKYVELAWVGLEEEVMVDILEDCQINECIANLEMSSDIKLMYKGKIIEDDETPKSMKMNKEDQVLVFSQLPDCFDLPYPSSL